MNYLQVWSHSLKPNMTFDDVISRTEKLCHEKRMRIHLDSLISEERRKKYGYDVTIEVDDAEEEGVTAEDVNLTLPSQIPLDSALFEEDPMAGLEEDKNAALEKLAELKRLRELKAEAANTESEVADVSMDETGLTMERTEIDELSALQTDGLTSENIQSDPLFTEGANGFSTIFSQT